MGSMETNEYRCLNISEILFKVLSYLTPRDLFHCRQVSSYWHQVVELFLNKGNEIEFKWYQTHVKFHKFKHTIKNNFNIHTFDGEFFQKCFISQLGLTIVIKRVHIQTIYWYYLLVFNYLGEYFEEFLFKGKIHDHHLKMVPSDHYIAIYVNQKLEKYLCFQTFSLFEYKFASQYLSEEKQLLSKFFRTDRFPRMGEITFPCKNASFELSTGKMLKTCYERRDQDYSFSIFHERLDYTYLIDSIESFNDKKTCFIRMKTDNYIQSCVLMMTCDAAFTRFTDFAECYLLQYKENQFPVFCPETKRIIIVTNGNQPNSIKFFKLDDDCLI
jgi:hypothetical protein